MGGVNALLPSGDGVGAASIWPALAADNVSPCGRRRASALDRDMGESFTAGWYRALQPMTIAAQVGEGEGQYPTIAPFRYRDHIRFYSSGQPFLFMEQRTKRVLKCCCVCRRRAKSLALPTLG